MKKISKINLSLLVIIMIGMLAGCNLLSYDVGKMKEALKGRESIVRTFDEDGNVIDQIKGKSIAISTEDKFDQKDEEGKTISKSSVIALTVGGKPMTHVGSSLVLHEVGLVDIFDEYAKKYDITDTDRAIPILNRVVQKFKNLTTGKSQVILIRSQSGKPIATFAGDNVSYFDTGIDKTTGILIDGKYIFIYRCDYTIYDTELLEQ